jgi:uncharacterized protein (DUF2141 family)
MNVQWVVWLAVWVVTNLPTLTFAQSSSCPGIHVQILNIRNSTGTVDCALFDAPKGFWSDTHGSLPKPDVARFAGAVMATVCCHRCGCECLC